MSIGVGDRLDKYELVERVGQGGMAVVYRGMDTSLRREVAVKVLHRHLADSQEARDRFEREAQAVAKLRHENILEIFDFSGVDSEESYIVTEFIDGQTLREFMNDHEIRHPEVGAMISVQVCRALGHAHELGVLHRDVKPENIMIRKDGVVKLTDFGIAQMLDLQRMTVTGQLLGSPAYMSPEHVEGKRLDFRTDVFAVGIVLYQLVTGELPFKGKNPHEILKRIAECKFLDPQVVNPMVGDELSRIVNKSLARLKDDRYDDVSQMLAALESYLDTSGLGDYRAEVQKFFTDAAAYEKQLPPRLVAALAERGKEQIENGQEVRALELFNRVLTLDPEYREVLDLLDNMGRRRRYARIGMLFGGVLILAGAVYGATRIIDRQATATTGSDAAAAVVDFDAEAAPDAQPAMARLDAQVDIAEAATDAGIPDAKPKLAVRADARARRPRKPDAGVTIVAAARNLRLTVSPKNSLYRVGSGPWQPISGSLPITIPAGRVVIEAKNDTCCQSRVKTIEADEQPDSLQLNLAFLPAQITPVCHKDGATVTVDGAAQRLGRPTTISLENTMGTKRVSVEFVYEGGVDPHSIEVGYKDDLEVVCK